MLLLEAEGFYTGSERREGILMDFIMEIVIGIIFEGALEVTTAKKVPMFIRVLVAVVLLTFYIGFGGIFVYIGIVNKSGVAAGCGVFLLVIVAVVVVRKYKEMKR